MYNRIPMIVRNSGQKSVSRDDVSDVDSGCGNNRSFLTVSLFGSSISDDEDGGFGVSGTSPSPFQ